jgi:SET domain
VEQDRIGTHVRCDGCKQPPFLRADGKDTVPLQRCTRCRGVAYHNVNCQRKHYRVHKAECRSLALAAAPQETIERLTIPSVNTQRDNCVLDCARVEERKDRGKCLIAIVDMEANQTIAPPSTDAFDPLVPPVLFTPLRQSHCASCFTASATMINLSKNVRYPVKVCSKACQANNVWLLQEIHAFDAMMERYENTMPDHVQIFPSSILVYRLLCLVACRGDDFWEDLMSFQSHEIAPHDDDREYAHQHATAVMVLSMLQWTRDEKVTALYSQRLISNRLGPLQHIQQLLQKVKYNAFTITKSASPPRDNNAEDESLGIGLYQGPSHRINHSCAPNAVQNFLFAPGRCAPRLHICTGRPIQAGEEVCISYLGEILDKGTKERQEVLLKEYRFHCECLRCFSLPHDEQGLQTCSNDQN